MFSSNPLRVRYMENKRKWL